MGNANPNTSLAKGEGYRVISLPPNPAWQHRLEPYFDFIIEATPKAPSKSATDILDKLAPQNEKSQPKPLLQLLREHVGQPITLKVVSTKYRKVRSEEINELGEADIAGLNLRKERYDEAFDSYFPVTAIQSNSPMAKSGVREGQYLIGCKEFGYVSIDAFMEGLYERYFDKEISDKTVQLALYDIASDSLLLKNVELRRGWGGKGLLGCDFLQGLLNKFPTQLE